MNEKRKKTMIYLVFIAPAIGMLGLFFHLLNKGDFFGSDIAFVTFILWIIAAYGNLRYNMSRK